MNKKFLSAILFGALMVTSTGTFVSCKDYDDDIDRIDQELTDIKSAIAALQSKVDGGKYVTNVAKNGDGITITWNDNSTSTIETIKGDKGDKTIVTIIDGYWAFDGVKSEYPAKGDKGDKGDAGEAASAGHDAQISDNGYWMVWDATKGAYVETEYIAGGATAVAGDHGWTIIVRDQNGKEQSIYIPNSADLVSIQDVNDYTRHDLDIYYGLVNKDVEWDGARAVNGKMEAGMYPVLSQDVQIMLNPTGVDGTAYKFGFRDSDNAEPWGLTFGDVQPYAGAKLTRAASESGVWVLPRVIERVPLNELDERADYVTQFRNNSNTAYVFALNATSKEDASKVIKSQYIYSFDPTNIGNMKADEFYHSSNPVAKDYYVWNQDHRPNFENYIWTSQSGSVEWLNVDLGDVIYDYKLEIDKTKMTQVNIEKYGLEVSKDGYTFKATKEAAVDNRMYFKLSYILVNGSKHTVDFYADIVAKDIVITDNNIGTLDKPFNATQLGTVAAGSNATQIAALDGKFVYTEQLPFDLKEKLGANYDEWIDAMYQALSTTGWSDADRAEFLQGQASITGGDPINNDATYNNTLIRNLVYFDYVDANGKSCIYNVRSSDRLARLGEIAALEVHFVAGTYAYNGTTWGVTNNKPVQTPYYTENGTQNWNSANGFAIPLNNAFSVQLLAQKEQQPVAALNFKFQLTQPEIDKVGILPQNGLFSQWAEEFTDGNKTADKLYSFGAYDANEMRLPLYEAFDMWIADGANLYRWQNKNAEWYYLKSDNVAADGITLLGTAAPTGWEPQTNNPYQINWKNYNTVATQSGDVMQYALSVIPSVKGQTDATIDVDVKYNFFGVYPALDEQLPFYSTGTYGTPSYQEHPGFRLIFASTIKKSTIKTKEDVYYAKAGTHYVFISNDDIVAKTMLDKEFVLLDGLNAAGVPETRKNLNDARGFNEDIRPFSISSTITATSVNTSGAPINLTVLSGTLQAGQTVWADGTTHNNTAGSLEEFWNINKPAATIEPALPAPTADSNIKIYKVASRQQFPVGNSTYPNGLPAVEGGYVIQLGQDIDYRQPVEVTFTVVDALGFTNTLKVKVQKLQN